MRAISVTAIAALLISESAGAAGGYASRDLNPILQPIYMPALAVFSPGNGWKVDNSLYITNTLQSEDKGDEQLLIDSETYRYELGLRYRHGKWLARADLPYIYTDAGELDGTIDAWHEFWGLPGGDRGDFPKDQIDIKYQRAGTLEYDQDSKSSGVGDIAFALGYQASDELAWFVGIELPTGDSDNFSGNEAVDAALWLSYQGAVEAEFGIFGMFGLSLPGDSDYLGGYVEDRIWVGQLGFDFRFTPTVIGTLQLDLHSATVEGSSLDAFGNSLQLVGGLGFLRLFGEHRLDLFFTEDLLVGTAPDFSLGIRLTRVYD